LGNHPVADVEALNRPWSEYFTLHVTLRHRYLVLLHTTSSMAPPAVRHISSSCHVSELKSYGIVACVSNVTKRSAANKRIHNGLAMAHHPPADPNSRDQEVLRANRELAAYFRGHRTEREARAALKIIKAFVREREGTDDARRRPLPGLKAQRPVPKNTPSKKRVPVKNRPRRPTPVEAAPPSAEPSGESDS
jgi:hypothetical protein